MEDTPDKLISELPISPKIIHLLKMNDIRTVKQLASVNLYQLNGISSTQRTEIKKALTAM